MVKDNTFILGRNDMLFYSDYYTISKNLLNDILFQIYRKENNIYLISEIEDNINREKNYFVLQNKITRNSKYKLNIGNEIKIGKLNLKVRKIHISNKTNNNNSSNKISETKTISNILMQEQANFKLNTNKSIFDFSEREPFTGESNENDAELDKKCRVCLESQINNNIDSNLNLNLIQRNDNVLISPCNCKGDHKYIHLSCLKKWLKSRYGSQSLNNPNSMLFSFPNKCEICQGIFPDVIEERNNFYDLADFVDIKFDDYIEFQITNNDENDNNEKIFLILKLIKNNYCFIGKGEHNHYIFSDQDMSDHHSKLYLDNNGNVFITDVNSETGTFVKMNGAIQLIDKNIIYFQNKNTFIKLELTSDSNCCLFPKKSMNYPEIYFKNNNFNLDMKKIFMIKEKEKIENNHIVNNENNKKLENNDIIKPNTYSTLISSTSNSNSSCNILADANKDNYIIPNNDSENNDSKLKNIKEIYYRESIGNNKNYEVNNNENINPNINFDKKESKLYFINENDIISNISGESNIIN